MRIRVDDEVEVISGNYKGVRGRVQRVILKGNKVVVTGVNIAKKHQKARPTAGRTPAQTGIIEFDAPIHVSKVMLVDPATDQVTRVGYRRGEDGQRIRVSKATGNDLD